MSRERSLFEAEWPSFMQVHQPYISARPQVPRPLAACSSTVVAAGRCVPTDPYTMYYQDDNMCYPTHFPYQQPSSRDSITLSSPDSPFHHLYSPPHQQHPMQVPPANKMVTAAATATAPKGENPREIRNKAEKQRRDKLNQSISELAGMVPPVVAASRKIDKTGVLRLTAHYLRAHQYVFGDSVGQSEAGISSATALTFLQLLNGFLITTTYKGIVVVISQNVQKYIGYTELELLGQNIMTIVHEDDKKMLKEQLMPKSNLLGPNGELLLPDEPNAKQKVVNALDNEKRSFIVRLKKLNQHSGSLQYVTCQVDGSLRKADRACRGYSRCCQMVRRARARGDHPRSSGNDVVFVGMVRPISESFISEREIETFRMEYRTRHSVDGQILQCEHRISLITGYMISEVYGLNAMNFMHRDDVRWVVVALREMYDQRRLSGSSCYRLMTKNGQFIYMKTQGQLEVDQSSRAVSTFVCTNTVIDEIEGKQLIKLMKKKFTIIDNNNEDMSPEPDEQDSSSNDEMLSVEDPNQLEQVIMHMVTNISSQATDDGSCNSTPDKNSSSSSKLSIIPPKKDRIVKAIKKIYGVLKIKNKSNSKKTSTTFNFMATEVLPALDEVNSDDVKIQEPPNHETWQFPAQVNQQLEPNSSESSSRNYNFTASQVLPTLDEVNSDDVKIQEPPNHETWQFPAQVNQQLEPNWSESSSRNYNFTASQVLPTLNEINSSDAAAQVLPAFNEIRRNNVKIEEPPNHITSQVPAKVEPKPKPKAITFEECFMNINSNNEYGTPSRDANVSDEVLAAVQLYQQGGCNSISGQTGAHKRSLGTENVCNTFKRQAVAYGIEREAYNDVNETNSLMFDDNNVFEDFFEPNEFGTQIDNNPLGLSRNMENNYEASYYGLVPRVRPQLYNDESLELIQNIEDGPESDYGFIPYNGTQLDNNGIGWFQNMENNIASSTYGFVPEIGTELDNDALEMFQTIENNGSISDYGFVPEIGTEQDNDPTGLYQTMENNSEALSSLRDLTFETDAVYDDQIVTLQEDFLPSQEPLE